MLTRLLKDKENSGSTPPTGMLNPGGTKLVVVYTSTSTEIAAHVSAIDVGIAVGTTREDNKLGTVALGPPVAAEDANSENCVDSGIDVAALAWL